MSTETEPRQGTDNPVDPIEGGDVDPIAHSLMAKAAWGQRALSPWVQRQLDTGRGSRDAALPRQPRVALTLAGTNSLLGRLQRAADKSRVWHPNVGSLNPLLVNNFTQTIINRFQDTGAKITSPPSTALVEETELPLAGIRAEATPEPVVETRAQAFPFSLEEVRRALEKSGSGGSQEPPASAPRPATGTRSTPAQRKPDEPAGTGSFPFSLAEVRAALEKPHFTQASERSVQRTEDQPATLPGQPQGAPPRRRVLSRVEEVTPTAGVPPAGGELSEPAADQPGAPPPLDIPPAPTQVQRQVDRSPSLPEPGEQFDSPELPTPPAAPTVVEVIPFPTRPRRERPTIIPAVQRQATPETGVPSTSKPAKEGATPAGGPEPAKSSPSTARTAPAETDQTDEILAQSGPEAGSETTVQRQPDLELPLRDLPISPAVPQTPTPEETGATAVSPPAPVQAHPGDRPGQPSTGTSQGPEPVVQRHPEPELPLREAAADSTPAKPASSQVQAGAQIEPMIETGSAPLTPVAEPNPQEIAVAQKQPDLEMPLREPSVASPTPAETVSSPPAQSAEAAPLQRREEAAAKPSDSTPTAKPAPQETPVVQRETELEMPLKETPVALTPAETASASPAQAAETAPLQRQEATAETSGSPDIPTAKPEPQEIPAVQRQPELEMPLREPSGLATPAETPSSPSAQPAEESPLQRQEESTAGTSDGPGRPLAKPDPQETLSVQRQPELEMPLKETPSSPPTQSTETAPLQHQEEVQETPAVQRQSELEMPLRETPVASTQAETPSSSPAQPTEAGPPQHREEVAAKTSGSSDIPTAKPEPQEIPAVQRQPELEMPLREPVAPSTPAETPSPAQAAETAPLQRQEEVPAETGDSSEIPTAKPEPQEIPMVQRQPDLEMPLREPSMPSTPAETVLPPPAQPAEAASLQRREEVAAKTSDSPGIPTAKPDLQEIPAVQRQPELEMPLKETPVASTPAETLSSPPTQSAETAPLQRHEEDQEIAGIQRQPELEMPLRETPVASIPAVQPDLELEMPLREPSVPSTPAETPSPAQPAEAAPLQRQQEATAKTSDRPGMPVVKPDLQEAPVVQKQSELEMPLKEPASTPASLEKGAAEVTGPGPAQDIPASGLADALVAPAVQGVKPASQRQADQALDLPLRQPSLPATEARPEGRSSELDLNQNILARAKASSDLPLLKPLPAPRSSLAQAKPDRQIAILPQARPEGTGQMSPGVQAQTELPVDASPASTPRSDLPLATPRWGETAQPAAPEQPLRLSTAGPAPATLQRQPALAPPPAEAITPMDSDIIQRVETETTAPPSGKSEGKSSSSADVEKLARQILPEIKRMLARERERWGR